MKGFIHNLSTRVPRLFMVHREHILSTFSLTEVISQLRAAVAVAGFQQQIGSYSFPKPEHATGILPCQWT
ncbi:hypothetical protein R1flu_026809 [Riccia fluitans]|uniref:Uncharacterized protein n=1 Tax=Riccia fluitans TaxID=41844 RepID=A0ABD1XJW2_9MARC